jgi:8-oxo-dGTP diphosphatase
VTKVRFHDPDFKPDTGLIYSVIAARFEDKWIFVRHHDRSTWEIPGGHIESIESPDDTARRELTEETGAEEFNLTCVATYSVEKEGTTGFGKLFLAEVTRINTLLPNSEIAETILLSDLPDNLTYPDIQPYLFRRVLEFLKKEA